MFMLLCGTLTSEYVLRCYMLLLQANIATLVYGILSQAIMFAQLCVPTVGVIYVTCEIWVYEICFYFLSFFCRVISIIRKGLTFRLPGGVVSYPSMLCPRGRAFRGCPTSGSLTFLLMFFFVSFSLSFFSHLARDLKSRITVCTLGLPSWKGATGKV